MAELPSGFTIDQPAGNLPEGFTVDKPPSQPSGFLENAADAIKSVPSGLLGGLSQTLSASGQAEAPTSGINPEEIPNPAETRKILEQNVTGNLPTPQGTAGKYGEAVGEFLGNPATWLGPEGMAVKAATGTTSALGSELLRHLTEGTAGESYASMLGAIAGGALPRAFSRLVTPLPISPERQAVVDTLRAEGIEPTAGQVTGSNALKYTESALGDAPLAGGKAKEAQTRIAEQFTRAALARVGETGDRLSPQVVDRAFTRIGNQFDNLAARNSANVDVPFLTEFNSAHNNYNDSVSPSLRKPIINKIAKDIADISSTDRMITGEQYKVWHSKIERARRGSADDPEAAMALADMRNSMDNLMERSIAANNPSDLGAWKEVRNQYRNMLVLEKIASGAGESAAEGLVSPAKLRQSVVSQGKRAYARGKGDFADLARAGENILRPLPTSTTTERAFVHTIPATLAGGTAATIAGAPFALPAAAAAIAAPGIAGRGVMSTPIQNYLKNQAMTEVLKNLPSYKAQAARSLLGSINTAQSRGGAIERALRVAKK